MLLINKVLRHLIFLSALLAPFCVVAQKKIYVEMDTSLRLSGDKCNFKEVKVIDNRKDKSQLGVVAAREFKKGRIILSETSLDTMLADFAVHYIKNEPKAKATCLIIVRDFNINYSNRATPTLYFSGDIFLGKDGQYRLAAAIDTLYEFVYSADKVGIVVSTMIADIIQSVATMADSAIKGTTFSETAAVQRYADTYKQYPIFASTPKEGLYRNLNEFLQNTPSITTLHRKDKADHDGRHRPPITTFYLDDEGERSDKVKKMFAIYDKQEWFVLNNNKKIVKMSVRNGDFYRILPMGLTLDAAQNYGLVGYIPIAVVLSVKKPEQRNGFYEMRFNPELKRFMPVAKVSN